MHRKIAMIGDPNSPSPRSFRDPSGALFQRDGRVFRIVTSEGQSDLRAFLESHAARNLIDSGRVVRTWEVASDEAGRVLQEIRMHAERLLRRSS